MNEKKKKANQRLFFRDERCRSDWLVQGGRWKKNQRIPQATSRRSDSKSRSNLQTCELIWFGCNSNDWSSSVEGSAETGGGGGAQVGLKGPALPLTR